jgi:hypothetical protein
MSRTMKSVVATRAALAAMIAVTCAVVVGGVSAASVPDANGVIHGCYKAQGSASALSVINTSVHPNCPAGYAALKWDARPPGIGVGTGAASPSTSGGAQCTMGEVTLFAQHGAYLPNNYEIAKGQMLPIMNNEPLFTLLRTEYGGNGTSTFALPNLQSLAPNHLTYAICVTGIFP